MKPPIDVKIFQDELADYWLENDILLCSVCKAAPRSVEALERSFQLIAEITNGRKVCLLTDTSVAGFGSEKARGFSISASGNHFKAMAMISNASYSSLLVNTFMTFNAQPLPMNMFSNESEARKWLENYLAATAS
jgi:hypothetical protein